MHSHILVPHSHLTNTSRSPHTKVLRSLTRRNQYRSTIFLEAVAITYASRTEANVVPSVFAALGLRLQGCFRESAHLGLLEVKDCGTDGVVLGEDGGCFQPIYVSCGISLSDLPVYLPKVNLYCAGSQVVADWEAAGGWSRSYTAAAAASAGLPSMIPRSFRNLT
jgi:hypothetical protein